MLWAPLVAGLAIVFVVIQGQMRSLHQPWAIIMSVSFGVIVMLSLIGQLESMVNLFRNLAMESGISSLYLAPVLKSIAVAYITSFGAQICRDADEETIADVVELSGKIVILIIALPVIEAILYSVLGIIGN